MTFKLDSGADVSVMSDSNYKELKPKQSPKTVKANLNSPGSPLNCHRQFIVKATVKGNVYHFRVSVVVNDVENLLSRGVVSHMNLLTKLDAVTYGVGCLKTDPVRVILKEDGQPSAVTVARRVSIPMLPKVKDGLQGLLNKSQSQPLGVHVSLEEIMCSTNLRRHETSQPQCGDRTVHSNNTTGFDLKVSWSNHVLVSRCRFGFLPNPATRGQSTIDDIHHADGSLLLWSPPIRNHVRDIHAENE